MNELLSVFERKQQIVERLQILSSLGLGELRPSDLVGALAEPERMLLMLAKNMIGCSPENSILLLDRAFVSLGSEDLDCVVKQLKSFCRKGGAVLYVCNSFEDCWFADKVFYVE